jgi:hypothetical protein
VEYALTQLLATDEFKGLPNTPDAVADMKEWLWENMAGQLFFEKVENAKELKDIGFKVELVKSFLNREKKAREGVAAQAAKVAGAAQRNAQALAPTPAPRKQGKAQSAPTRSAPPKSKDPDDVIGSRDYGI